MSRVRVPSLTPMGNTASPAFSRMGRRSFRGPCNESCNKPARLQLSHQLVHSRYTLLLVGRVHHDALAQDVALSWLKRVSRELLAADLLPRPSVIAWMPWSTPNRSNGCRATPTRPRTTSARAAARRGPRAGRRRCRSDRSGVTTTRFAGRRAVVASRASRPPTPQRDWPGQGTPD